MNQASFLPISVVLVAALAATITDLRAFRISNLLTLPLLLSGLVYHTVVGGGTGFVDSFLGALFGFGVLFVFYLMGGMGGGDVKLLTAIGAWLGLSLTVYVFVVSALVGGVVGAALILANGRVREAWFNMKIIWFRVAAIGRQLGAEDHIEAEVNRADRRRRVIPFAAMIALGVAALFVWSFVKGQP